MKRMTLIAYGLDYKALADALEHAVQQLRMGTPSENITWEDNSHVSFDVWESSVEEFERDTGETLE